MNISSVSNFAKNTISVLGNSSERLPVVLLEGSVTGGRTYQGYKRGGKTEALERVREESIAAFFWIWGIELFNKIGDAFGKHALKLPITDFDTGEDALRTPMKNVMKSIETGQPAEFLKDKALEVFDKGRKNISEKSLSVFKFSKIVLSVAASLAIIGVALPKFNQKLTANRLKKEKAEKDSLKTSNDSPSGIDEFKKKVSTSSKVAFGANAMSIIAHNLENNKIANLLTNDCGMLVGRSTNARNKDERIEILFRDVASIYFYLRCREDVKNLLQNHTSGGKLTKLNPNCAGVVSDYMLKEAQKTGGILNMQDFIGSISNENKAVLAEFDKRAQASDSTIKNGVISLEELKEFLPKSLQKKADAMSKLQPEQAKKGFVLTRTQLEDVLSNGKMTETEFLMDAYKKNFGEALTNDYKYIPMKKINEYRKHLTEYVNAVFEYAGKKDSLLADDIIKANRASTVKSLGFFALGFAVSAAFLSTIIPKTQYLITRLRTGKNEFPGIEEQEQKKA